MKKPKDSSVFICGIVRNAEKRLKNNLPVVEDLISAFKDGRAFIYENDSNDNSKAVLTDWATRFPDQIEVSLNNNVSFPEPSPMKEGVNQFFSRNRIEKMVWLRNKYLDYVESTGWNGDYFIVVDLDVAHLDVKSILASFDVGQDWDAISAYGYSYSPKLKERYHDTYAYCPAGRAYDNPQTEKDIYGCQKDFEIFKRTGKLMPVSSAFGGLTIYRWEAIKGLRYRLEMNNDNRVECYCEHKSMYHQMYERGFSKFFINPQMRLKYQGFNLNLLSRWLRSKLQH